MTNIELTKEGEELQREMRKRSCIKCSHFQICEIYIANKLIAETYKQQRGVEPIIIPENLAEVCTKYQPMEINDDLGNQIPK